MSNPDSDPRFEQQLRFFLEIDRLKHVLRRNPVADGSRRENTAEHSWHAALLAVLLLEYADAPDLDAGRVTAMLLFHDVVEADVGDTYLYHQAARAAQAARERAAAQRLFALLPPGQAEALRALWDEFETGETPEARYARAIDRLHPLVINYHTQGASWREHGVRAAQVRAVCRPPIHAGAPRLWELAARLIDDAVDRGYLEA